VSSRFEKNSRVKLAAGLPSSCRYDTLRSAHSLLMDTREKILSRDGLHEVLDEHRHASQQIVFASGMFDLLHCEDVRYLRAARAEGNLLVVIVHSDSSARKLGLRRGPVFTERARAALVAALAAVDYVVIVDEANVTPLLREFQPHVYVQKEAPKAAPASALEPGLAGLLGIRIVNWSCAKQDPPAEPVERARPDARSAGVAVPPRPAS
jgi:glycerol-3-phosphate cytidylyltransferase-like family protein